MKIYEDEVDKKTFSMGAFIRREYDDDVKGYLPGNSYAGQGDEPEDNISRDAFIGMFWSCLLSVPLWVLGWFLWPWLTWAVFAAWRWLVG
jgi:hypothetical protein